MPIPTNTKNTKVPYRKDLFETYLTWKSVPTFLRKSDMEQIARSFGIEEDVFSDLLSIPTQTAFAEKYDVELSTLSNWNRLIEKRDMLKDMRKWARKLSKNVVCALYKNILQTGNPYSIKLWFQFVDGWSERTISAEPEYRGVTEITYTVIDRPEQIATSM